MQKFQDQLFDRVEQLAQTVKQDFKGKGLMIPHRRKDGSVQIGTYSIHRHAGVFTIRNHQGKSVVSNITLAQTAIVAANDLALGYELDLALIQNDRWYGFKEFDEKIATCRLRRLKSTKDIDLVCLHSTKLGVARTKKLYYKKYIDMRFGKLYRLV